jgi:putative membrane protein
MVMMFWFDHDVSGWGWIAMSASMILFWALIITAGALLLGIAWPAALTTAAAPLFRRAATAPR